MNGYTNHMSPDDHYQAVKAGDNTYNPAEALYELEITKKNVVPSISGTVTKKYDKTTSIENATVNTLSIILEGVLEKDRTKTGAAAKYKYESADAGNNKKIIATDIVLSGEMACNYILSTDMVSANIGSIEAVITGGNTGSIWGAVVNTPGGDTGTTEENTTDNSPGSNATSVPGTGNSGIKPTSTPNTGNSGIKPTSTPAPVSVPDIPVLATPSPVPVQDTSINNTITNPDGSVTTIVTEVSGGNVKEANAAVSKTTDSGNKITLSKDETEQIIKAAGTTDVKITITAKDETGREQYKVSVYTKDLAAGNKLYIYELNTKTGEYTMVNSREYTVSNTGNIQISMKDNKTYELVSGKESQKINKKIYNSIKVGKTSVNVKKGKKIQFSLNSKLNKANIKSITYASSKKKVASVSSKGKITAKKKGNVTVKAKVVLKNGMYKTISIKVKVK